MQEPGARTAPASAGRAYARATPAPSATRPTRARKSRAPRRSRRERRPCPPAARRADRPRSAGRRRARPTPRSAVHLHVRACEVAVAPVAARPDARLRLLERAREERQRGRVELDPHAAPLRHLVRVAEQAEAGDVGDRVRRERPQHVGGLPVQRGHRRGRRLQPHLVAPALAAACSSIPVPSGLVRKTASPGRAPLFAQNPSGWTVPTTARPYFGSSSRSGGRRRGSRRPRAPARPLLRRSRRASRWGGSPGRPRSRARAAAPRPSRRRR